MKLVMILLTILILVGVGVGGYIYLSQKSLETARPKVKQSTVLSGSVQKVFDSGVDYSHLLKTSTSVVPLSSYSVKLDEYVGKNVEVTGQYSGTTLYVDNVVQK